MILIKKCDRKNRLSAHPHKGIHPFRPVKKPAQTGLLQVESGDAMASTQSFVEDFSIEHSSSGVSVLSISISANSDSVVASTGASNPPV
jgi:hypothetical protein